jgi:hypothetical protein
MLVPLDREDQFLGLHLSTGVATKEKASFAAIYRRRGSRIEFDSVVEMPSPFGGVMGRPRLEPTSPIQPEASAGSSLERWRLEGVDPLLYPTLEVPPMTQDLLVLAAPGAGVLWFFSLLDGQCTRVLNTQGVKENELGRLRQARVLLLDIKPRKDGSLLMATKSPEVMDIALSRDWAAQAVLDPSSEETFQDAVSGKTGIWWWSVDPVNGKVEPATPAVGLPTLLPSYQLLNRFFFLLDWEGRGRYRGGPDWRKDLKDAPTSVSATTSKKIKPKS